MKNQANRTRVLAGGNLLSACRNLEESALRHFSIKVMQWHAHKSKCIDHREGLADYRRFTQQVRQANGKSQCLARLCVSQSAGRAASGIVRREGGFPDTTPLQTFAHTSN
jgi:hypothetical protein